MKPIKQGNNFVISEKSVAVIIRQLSRFKNISFKDQFAKTGDIINWGSPIGDKYHTPMEEMVVNATIREGDWDLDLDSYYYVPIGEQMADDIEDKYGLETLLVCRPTANYPAPPLGPSCVGDHDDRFYARLACWWDGEKRGVRLETTILLGTPHGVEF